MKTKNIVLGCLMLSLSFTSVFAGDKGGNGGDGIVCGNKVTMLDSVEMEKRGLTLNLPGPSLREKVSAVIARVEKVDKARAFLLKSYSQELVEDIEGKEAGATDFKVSDFTRDILVDVPDSLELTTPRGCVKEQLVTQKDPVFPEDKRYTISLDLFDLMDVDQKAMMVLHESWYRIFLKEGANDSRFARYLNGMFTSKEKSELSLKEYLEVLQYSSKIGSIYAYYYAKLGTYMIKLSPYKYENGTYKPSTFSSDGLISMTAVDIFNKPMTQRKISIDGGKVYLGTVDINTKGEIVNVNARMSYYDEGFEGFNSKRVKVKSKSSIDIVLDENLNLKSLSTQWVSALDIDGVRVKGVDNYFYQSSFGLELKVDNDGTIEYKIK